MSTYTRHSSFHNKHFAAYSIARMTLENELDKHNQPLIYHVERVTKTCQDKNLSDDQVLAALLHEVIEDGGLDVNTIERLFGTTVAVMVRFLTRDSDMDRLPYIAYIDQLIAECPEAIPVKLADLEDNLDSSRGPIPESLRTRYLLAHSKLTTAWALYKIVGDD